MINSILLWKKATQILNPGINKTHHWHNYLYIIILINLSDHNVYGGVCMKLWMYTNIVVSSSLVSGGGASEPAITGQKLWAPSHLKIYNQSNFPQPKKIWPGKGQKWGEGRGDWNWVQLIGFESSVKPCSNASFWCVSTWYWCKRLAQWNQVKVWPTKTSNKTYRFPKLISDPSAMAPQHY